MDCISFSGATWLKGAILLSERRLRQPSSATQECMRSSTQTRQVPTRFKVSNGEETTLQHYAPPEVRLDGVDLVGLSGE